MQLLRIECNNRMHRDTSAPILPLAPPSTNKKKAVTKKAASRHLLDDDDGSDKHPLESESDASAISSNAQF